MDVGGAARSEHPGDYCPSWRPRLDADETDGPSVAHVQKRCHCYIPGSPEEDLQKHERGTRQGTPNRSSRDGKRHRDFARADDFYGVKTR